MTVATKTIYETYTERFPRSRELAERACALTGYQMPVLVGTLGAAYAAAGRFSEAMAVAEKARALAEAAGQRDVADRNRQLLELYRSGRPCLESQASNSAAGQLQ